jgi:hypothetical protein
MSGRFSHDVGKSGGASSQTPGGGHERLPRGRVRQRTQRQRILDKYEARALLVAGQKT